MFKTPSTAPLYLLYSKCGDAHFELNCYNTDPAESILSDKFIFIFLLALNKWLPLKAIYYGKSISSCVGDCNCQKYPYSFHMVKVIILVLCRICSYQPVLFVREKWSLHSSVYFSTSNAFLNFTFLKLNCIKMGSLKAYSLSIINSQHYCFSSFSSLILW